MPHLTKRKSGRSVRVICWSLHLKYVCAYATPHPNNPKVEFVSTKWIDSHKLNSVRGHLHNTNSCDSDRLCVSESFVLLMLQMLDRFSVWVCLDRECPNNIASRPLF